MKLLTLPPLTIGLACISNSVSGEVEAAAIKTAAANSDCIGKNIDEEGNGSCTPVATNATSNTTDEETEEEEFMPYDVLAMYKDMHQECHEWAKAGDCNSNPLIMLRECIPSCFSNASVQEHGILSWTTTVGSTDFDCQDTFHPEQEEDEDCHYWAEEGLCINPEDKPFMLTQCKESCAVCIPAGETWEIHLGEGQLVLEETFDETVHVLWEMARYMKMEVYDTQNELFHSNRLECQNHDAMCATWAAEGNCEEGSDHYDWMVLHCAPVCKTCELLDFQIRCPVPDDWEDAIDVHGGDNGLNAMFERIVGDRRLTQDQIDGGIQDMDLKIDILSKPGGDEKNYEIIDGAWVITFDDFLTEEECDRLIQAGDLLGYNPSLETSTLANGSLEEDHTSEQRTSTNAWCNDNILEGSETSCKEDPIVKKVRERMALVTGFPTDNSEDLQLLFYQPGQFYKQHHDYIKTHAFGPSGPRVLTFFLYLNDVEEGGGTQFPYLAEGADPVVVQPKRGKALLWPSVLNEDANKIDPRTEHEALEVLAGEKYGANAWLHLRDEQHIEGIECG